jgi:AraC family transcriptional regulator of adaptative response/methylated-DNA-[protein]-cysteine methyltransferase
VDLWLSPHDARIRALRSGGMLSYGVAPTPFGDCVALLSEGRILAVRFTEDRTAEIAALRAEWPGATVSHDREADARIPGIFNEPGSVPLMAVGTPFQLTVWEFLRSIPKGTTLTYGDVARAIGRPKAARAVGRAVGTNELSIVIPCHRVVSRGKLTGYRWGLDRKKALLAWELSTRDPLEMPF